MPALTPLQHVLSLWSNEPTIAANVVEWRTDPPRAAQWADLPGEMHPALRGWLRQKGIRQLYVHQAQAFEQAMQGSNLVIVTDTASGKTLCYNLPVLQTILQNPAARALYLFPTKALTQDQWNNLREASAFLADATASQPVSAAIYDGDTPQGNRAAIRKQARILLSNPDMLHTGILPHHTLWADFFSNLQFVVLDETHTYRGVFGSHVANLLRRLKRIAHFYGSNPQFILTSATIANPADLAEKLIEAPVSTIDIDGSPRGQRHFLLYNPPIVDKNLGLRASASGESLRLVDDLLHEDVQSLLFCRARVLVERMLRSLRERHGEDSTALRAYRSGYLRTERRKIEADLREGRARAVVATNALELGIDVGGMDAVLLVSYPGTIASTRQQAGRAGRKQGSALAVLVASANPLDQYIMQHPEYIFNRSPEQALINPDNLLILVQHLRCAAFELPFHPGDRFGTLEPDTLRNFLDMLCGMGDLTASENSYFWMASQYPATSISLRGSSPMQVALQCGTLDKPVVIGQVDYESALWMVHPKAVYLHNGQSYQVDRLDLETRVAHLKTAEVDYYTEPIKQVEIEKLSVMRQAKVAGGEIFFGEIMVTTQVVGFRRVKWFTYEDLGQEELDLPATQLRTTGYWLKLDSELVDDLRETGEWTNDPNNYGPNWPLQRKLAMMRDKNTCQNCGARQEDVPLQVHHKQPFRTFAHYQQANDINNLVTLCPKCHRQVEAAVKMRSGLSGLGYVLQNLAPLFLMCDIEDLGMNSDPLSPLADRQPAIALFDTTPGGIGLSEMIFETHVDLVRRAQELVLHCACLNGCPSCVGAAGPEGAGGKESTLAILKRLAE